MKSSAKIRFDDFHSPHLIDLSAFETLQMRKNIKTGIHHAPKSLAILNFKTDASVSHEVLALRQENFCCLFDFPLPFSLTMLLYL